MPKAVRAGETVAPYSPSNWREASRYIADFGAWDLAFQNVFSQPGSFIIHGEPGFGKSTFVLWSLASTGFRGKSWFKRVLFLHRFRPDEWRNIPRRYPKSDTLVLVDAPFESTDDAERRRDKAQTLCLLRNLDGFHVVATMRSDEWAEHQKNFTTVGYAELKLPWSNIRLWEVLQKRVLAWGGPDLSRADSIVSVIWRLPAWPAGANSWPRCSDSLSDKSKLPPRHVKRISAIKLTG